MVALLIILSSIAILGIFFWFYQSIASMGPKKLFQQAVIAYESGNIEKAIELLEKALEVEPASLEVRWMLAELYRKSGRPELAIKTLREVLEWGLVSDPKEEIKFRKKLAEIYKELGNIGSAYEELSEVIKINPDDIETRMEMSRLLIKRELWDKAIVELQALLARAPEHVEALYYLGMVNFRLERFVEAKEKLTKAVTLNPNHKKAHFYLGLIFYRNKNWQKAIEHLEKAKDDPEVRSKAVRYLAEAYYETENWEKAAANLEEAIQLLKSEGMKEQEMIDLYYKLGVCYEMLKQHQKAVENWKVVAKYDPHYEDVQIKLEGYANLDPDDPLREFILTPANSLEAKCRSIVETLGYRVRSSRFYNKDEVDIVAVDDREKVSYFAFKRWLHEIGDMVLKELKSKMEDVGAERGVILTCGGFSPSARAYAENRKIDLYDKNAFRELLQKVKEIEDMKKSRKKLIPTLKESQEIPTQKTKTDTEGSSPEKEQKS